MILSGKEDEAFALMTKDSTQNLSDEINNSIDNLFETKISSGGDKSKSIHQK